MKPGEKVRFFEDREMRGRFVDVRVTGVEPIDLSRCSPERLEAWSQAEGWSPESGRGYGKKFGAGVQNRYEPIPGQEILAESDREDDTHPAFKIGYAPREERGCKYGTTSVGRGT